MLTGTLIFSHLDLQWPDPLNRSPGPAYHQYTLTLTFVICNCNLMLTIRIANLIKKTLKMHPHRPPRSHACSTMSLLWLRETNYNNLFLVLFIIQKCQSMLFASILLTDRECLIYCSERLCTSKTTQKAPFKIPTRKKPNPLNYVAYNWRARHSQVCSIENRRYIYYILEKWFPLWGERAHSLKLFSMYDKRFEI